MNGKLSIHLSRLSIILAACAAVPILALQGYGATIGLTMSVSPNSASPSPGSYPGWTNTFYLPYTANDGSVSVGTTNVATNFGSFITDVFNANPPNPNVSSTFALSLVPTIGAQSTTLTFYGTVTNPSNNVFDLNFSTSSTGSGTTGFYGGQTYAIQKFDGYTFGIVNTFLLNSPGKTTTLTAFVGPTQAPEPLPAATTALAMLGLLGFVVRRKVFAKQS